MSFNQYFVGGSVPPRPPRFRRPCRNDCAQYLIDKLNTLKFFHKYSTRKSLFNMYRLPTPKTNNLKRTLFYTSLKLLQGLNIDFNTKPKVARKAFLVNSMKSFNHDNFKVNRIY